MSQPPSNPNLPHGVSFGRRTPVKLPRMDFPRVGGPAPESQPARVGELAPGGAGGSGGPIFAPYPQEPSSSGLVTPPQTVPMPASGQPSQPAQVQPTPLPSTPPSIPATPLSSATAIPLPSTLVPFPGSRAEVQPPPTGTAPTSLPLNFESGAAYSQPLPTSSPPPFAQALPPAGAPMAPVQLGNPATTTIVKEEPPSMMTTSGTTASIPDAREAAKVIVYGRSGSAACLRAIQDLMERQVSFQYVDVARDPAAAAHLTAICNGEPVVPVIVHIGFGNS